MKHVLPELGFAPDALRPFSSAETFEFHHGKHHRGYVEKLNALLEGSEHEGLGLTELVKRADGPLFDNAAQHFNHSFFWRCIAPGSRGGPEGQLRAAIESDFGSIEGLKRAFTRAATAHFGSGWCWLVKAGDGRLAVQTTSDAGCPLTCDETPLLTCDVWEHAYYIDYRNARPEYVEGFWRGVNWDFVNRALTCPGEIEGEILGCSVTEA